MKTAYTQDSSTPSLSTPLQTGKQGKRVGSSLLETTGFMGLGTLPEQSTSMRTFNTGATRDSEQNKKDYEGYLSPLVLDRFAEYMLKHQTQADGAFRSSDNWQNGIPKDAYMKSGWRHFMDWWTEHRGYKSREGLEDALCALLFNVQGYLHEHLKQKYGESQKT